MYAEAVSAAGAADDGSRELLNIEEAPIASESFSVGFFFKNGKLVCVNIRPNGEYSQAQCERVYSILRRSLVAKYGNTASGSVMSGGNYRKEAVTWTVGGVEICLSKEFIGSKTVLALCYRKGIADAIDLDNL